MVEKSGYIYAPASSQYPYQLYVSVNESATNLANNTSTLTLKGHIYGQYIGFDVWQSNKLQLYWTDDNEHPNGILVREVIVKKVGYGSGGPSTVYIEGTVTVKHKKDGTLKGWGSIKFKDETHGTVIHVPPTASINTSWYTLTSLTPKEPPQAGQISVEKVTQNSAKISWSNFRAGKNSKITNYKVAIGQDYASAPWHNNGLSTTYSRNDLKLNTTYYAWVQAESDNGLSSKVVTSVAFRTVTDPSLLAIKTGGTWKRGRPFIKIDNQYKRVKNIYIKIDNGYKLVKK